MASFPPDVEVAVPTDSMDALTVARSIAIGRSSRQGELLDLVCDDLQRLTLQQTYDAIEGYWHLSGLYREVPAPNELVLSRHFLQEVMPTDVALPRSSCLGRDVRSCQNLREEIEPTRLVLFLNSTQDGHPVLSEGGRTRLR
jgi:hypothetical protein